MARRANGKDLLMAKYTAEELEQESKRRKEQRDATPDKLICVNCGRSYSALSALELEHGLCEDCLMKDDD